MNTLYRIYLLIFIFVGFPITLLASGNGISPQSENVIPDKPNTLFIEKLETANNSRILSGLNISDNGVTRVNDGHLMIKISGYSDSTIMKYVNSMGCSLPRKLSLIKSFDSSDKFQNLKTVNNGLYIKSGIEAEKGSGIFFLVSGGVELDDNNNSTNNQLYASNVFAGGGVGYFLKNYSMQFGYDNKFGTSTSIGILW
jgi:hypothetical protein